MISNSPSNGTSAFRMPARIARLAYSPLSPLSAKADIHH
jgi:hypothetical protein